MLSIQTILYPTDFSDRSESTFRLACALARDYGARLYVLHVVSEPIVIFSTGILPRQSDREQDELWKRLQQTYPSDHRTQIEYCLAHGDTADAILRAAREAHCDLIMMATHGRTGIGRLLMGSVAEKVVRKAECPVVTIKSPSAGPASTTNPTLHDAMTS